MSAESCFATFAAFLANAVESPAQAASSMAAEAPAGGGIGLLHYLLVSAVSFGLGLLIVITRRNAIAVLMGIELMINSAGLNFVAFGKFSAPNAIDGQIVTLFAIVIAAAEAALALAIVLNVFSNLNTVQVDEANKLQG
jgi:NADH-quinone oxidoreductase subunit K